MNEQAMVLFTICYSLKEEKKKYELNLFVNAAISTVIITSNIINHITLSVDLPTIMKLQK